jgi:3-hydroxybutyryl-CoA dehydrogenase
MLHPELLDPDDIQAISHEGPQARSAEAASKLLRSRPESPITVKSGPDFVVEPYSAADDQRGFLRARGGGCQRDGNRRRHDARLQSPDGPLALANLIGLDVLLAVMQTIHDEFGDPKYRPCPLPREMVAAGFLGRKTRRGVYRY